MYIDEDAYIMTNAMAASNKSSNKDQFTCFEIESILCMTFNLNNLIIVVI